MMKIPNVYLKAGEFFISSEPARVITVLGSCVSVIMFNERLGIGAICHALLPRNIGTDEDLKYVDSSIFLMIRAFERLKIGREEIDVKLFGGANLFKTGSVKSLPPSIGEQNVKTALTIIDRQKLNLLASDVGGQSGRKLYYYIHTNRVFVKRLKNMSRCP